MVSMQNSKVLAGMNGSRTQRYRPASEVDDDTLARKREYWRKKKREQRAKLSALKKENHDVRKPAVFTSVLPAPDPVKNIKFIPRLSPTHTLEDNEGFTTAYDGLAEPTLLNSDGSYQTASSGPPGLLVNASASVLSEEYKGSDVSLGEIQKDWKNDVLISDCTEQVAAHHSWPSENGSLTITSQAERWCQRAKLQEVLPQLPEAYSKSLNDPNSTNVGEEVDCLMGDFKDGTFHSAKPNGALFNSCSQVPAAQVQPQTNNSLQCHVQNGTDVLNGSSSSAVSERHAQFHVASGQSGTEIAQMNMQPRSTSLRSVTTCVSPGEKASKDPSHPVTSQTSRTKSTIMPTAGGERNCVREVSKVVTPRQTSGRRVTFETEEEKAARQREYWRIKKREQRARLTASPVKAREKTRAMTTVLVKNEQSSCIVLERPPSTWCKARQRQPANRARTPLTPVSLQRASRLLKNAKAVAVSSSAPRYSNTVVQASPSQSFPVLGNLPASNDRQLAIATKTEKLCETKTLKGFSASRIPRCSVKLDASIMHEVPRQISETSLHSQKLQDGDNRWGVVRSKTQRPRFLRNASQRSTMKLSPAASLILAPSQRGNAEETTEEKMARKREYWRIKKREQRAKLSAEVKAKMKERDALMRRIKRYQSILEEMRKARAGTGGKALQPQENVLTSDADAIGGFIKEDGTVTTEIPQVSKDLRLSGPEPISEIQSLCKVPVTSDASTGTDVVRRVQVNVPPTVDSPSQVKDSSQLTVASPLGAPKLLPSRVKPVSRSIPKGNPYTPCLPKTRASFRYLQNVRNTYPKITLVKPRSNAVKIVESCSPAGIKERSDLVVCPLGPRASLVAPSQTVQLTEEERMAKKREYWRIKKREQRAKCSARRSQALSHFKHNILLPRQQNLKLGLSRRSTVMGLSKSAATSTSAWKFEAQSSVASQGNVKQESESVPADEGQCPSTHPPLCEDVKPLLLAPPQQQVESDPAQGLDTQETTLLAVASMKKLLEESLSTVLNSDGLSSRSNEEPLCKSEENVPDLDIKPSLPCYLAASEEASPSAKKQHDVPTSIQESAEVKHFDSEVERTSMDFLSCQTPTDASSIFNAPLPGHVFCQASSTAPSSSQTLLPPAPCSETATQTPACSHVCPTSNQPLPLVRSLRPNLKRSRQCYSPEPSKTMQASCQPEEDVLQKRREYWRMMKREQRARKAAREKEMKKQAGSTKSMNVAHQVSVALEEQPRWRGRRREQMGRKVAQNEAARGQGTTWGCKPILPAKAVPERVEQQELKQRPEVNGLQSAPLQCVIPSAGSTLTCLQAIPALPTLLVVSSTPCRTSLSTGSLHVQPNVPEMSPIKDKKQEDATSHPSEPSKPVLTPAQLEEDLRRKKREYWRGRKREQRARKAAQDREMKQASRASQPNLCIQGEPKKLQQQEHHSSQWINCTEETDLLHSSSSTGDLGLLPHLCQTSGVKGDVEMELIGKDDEVEEDGHMGLSTTADTWKSHFLMDYEPLNQLLVCMVCGELQHSHTLEGVRAHIEEAHPDTLSLGPCERQRIQEAWDEQVSVRERFYSSQLQQQGPDMRGGCNGGPAEVEVLVDLEDFTDPKNGKLSKSKSVKKA